MDEQHEGMWVLLEFLFRSVALNPYGVIALDFIRGVVITKAWKEKGREMKSMCMSIKVTKVRLCPHSIYFQLVFSQPTLAALVTVGNQEKNETLHVLVLYNTCYTSCIKHRSRLSCLGQRVLHAA
jgi:hypothetical protein